MGYLVTVLPAALLGFIAGLATLKRSSRWCPVCGEALRCTHCVGQPTPVEAMKRLEIRR